MLPKGKWHFCSFLGDIRWGKLDHFALNVMGACHIGHTRLSLAITMAIYLAFRSMISDLTNPGGPPPCTHF